MLHQLLEALRDNDNSHNAFDDGAWLAGFVTALGHTRPADAGQLAHVLTEIDRQLAHEAVVGTHRSELGAACLRAVTALACRVQPPPVLDPATASAAAADPAAFNAAVAAAAGAAARGLLADARALLLRYAGRSANPHMRAAAHECLMLVRMGWGWEHAPCWGRRAQGEAWTNRHQRPQARCHPRVHARVRWRAARLLSL